MFYGAEVCKKLKLRCGYINKIELLGGTDETHRKAIPSVARGHR